MIFVVRGPLRRVVSFKQQVEVEAETVNEGVSALCVEYPDLKRVLLDGSGQLRGMHRLALNRTLLTKSEMDTPVKNDDVVELVTALAGG